MSLTPGELQKLRLLTLTRPPEETNYIKLLSLGIVCHKRAQQRESTMQSRTVVQINGLSVSDSTDTVTVSFCTC